MIYTNIKSRNNQWEIYQLTQGPNNNLRLQEEMDDKSYKQLSKWYENTGIQTHIISPYKNMYCILLMLDINNIHVHHNAWYTRGGMSHRLWK